MKLDVGFANSRGDGQMARPASKYPTELELQILKVLWQQSPLLARDVQQALAGEGRDLAVSPQKQ